MTKRNQGPAQVYFREHVNDVTEDCMIWPYSTNDDGYGRLKNDQRSRLATTVACEVHYGPPPAPGMHAAHGPCHNPACWNWQHLSWKTPAENAADRLRDGTQPRGEAHCRAKLTEAEVREIRARYAAGGTSYAILAREYGVDVTGVRGIVTRETWTHI